MSANPFLPRNIEALYGFGRPEEMYDINNQRTVGTTNWLITAGEMFNSTIDGDYAKTSACYDVDMFLSHNVQGNVTSTMTSSGVLIAGNVKVWMPLGDYGVTIKQNLSNATSVNQITILRMAIVGGNKSPIQEMDFNNCIFSTFQQKNDCIMFSFRFTDFVDTYLAYDQTGNNKGQKSTSIDLSKWVVGDVTS